MSDRTLYRRLHHEQFTQALNQLDLCAEEFAFLTGANHRKVRRWLNGDEPDIPQWCALVCTLMTRPGAGKLAWDVARAMVIQPEKESSK